MTAIKIRKIGSSLGLILQKQIKQELGLFEGDFLELTKVANKKFLLEAPLPHHSKWKFHDSDSLNIEDKEWLEADLEKNVTL